MQHRSIRLHLDKQLESSGASTATVDSVPSSWSDGEPSAPPIPFSIALRGSMAEAEALHDRVDFTAFVKLAESTSLPNFRDGQAQWKRVDGSPTFSLLKRENEVLALARLDASVEEVASILGATRDNTHTATMKGLYNDSFIAGSVAYVQRPQIHDNEKIYQHLAVKTSSFVHSDLLGKNEQWCFAETFRCSPDGASFSLTQASLTAQQAKSLPARLALNDNNRRVAQLRDVNTAYLVERLPGSHGIRVVFHALYQLDSKAEEENHKQGEAPAASQKAVRSRLLLLARGISRLSQLVRRRRFGAQVFADRSAFDERNPRCTCCTRKFTLFIPRSRCYLCGYYVCLVCLSSEKMETHNGKLASIMICTRCRKSVVACDYDKMLTVLPGPERVLSDSLLKEPIPLSPSTASTSSESWRSSTSSESSSQMLADLLGQVVDDDPDDIFPGRRHAALVVLEQLLSASHKETQIQVDKNAESLRSSTSEAATLAMDISNYPIDPSACTFASATARPYPMIPAIVELDNNSTKLSDSITYPIPENEDVRLAAIDHFSLHDVANVPELNVICTLAAAEMGVPHSVITLVERQIVTLLATNSPENWDVGSGNPREQTFCQHFVMEDQPLLVRHAEADMRFYHIAPVVMRSLRFYAGFPISVSKVVKSEKAEEPENVVVGALCCLDATPHQMTRSQYWRLMKLATAASEILQTNGEKYIASLENGVRENRTVSVHTLPTNNPIAAVAC
ncbi:hypothetical protein PHMEG_0003600 [Phytophthora megakarya]|uniref:FYVE-type domain-containing protein n=1 Tax=Phytophthora megakarya TaxID=4795 RepID=A0A225WXH1_9STRA|nr:hypothetical protein PHMEG_0003600 [Phytophthora megakarya]